MFVVFGKSHKQIILPICASEHNPKKHDFLMISSRRTEAVFKKFYLALRGVRFLMHVPLEMLKITKKRTLADFLFFLNLGGVIQYLIPWVSIICSASKNRWDAAWMELPKKEFINIS